MGTFDYIIIAIVIALIILAIRSGLKRSKKGGCGCGCDGCPYKDNCEKK